MRLRRETFRVDGLTAALRRLREVHLIPTSEPPVDDVGFVMSVEQARALAVELLEWCTFLDPPDLSPRERSVPRLGDRPPTMRQTLTWVNERRQNCLDFAAGRKGADKEQWIEDARFFAQIPHFLDLYANKIIDEVMKEYDHDPSCARTKESPYDPNCPACQVADQIALIARTGPVNE
jgi:hypothetical protein